MNKEQKILYMFDELGKIDDKYVNEALLSEKKKSVRQSKFTRILAVAACIALISAACLTLVSKLSSIPQAPNDSLDDLKEAEDYLMNSLEGINIELLSSFEVPENDTSLLYDESVRLIWTYGNGVYYSVRVKDTYDVESLENYLANDKVSDFERNNAYGDFRFWISYGNGITETPYLSDNSGRISVGSLSDYLPEVLPSDDFARLIEKLIRKQISASELLNGKEWYRL